MITWTSKAVLTAALALLVGCDDMQGLIPSGAKKPIALSQATMAGGKVTLKPPAGFCIDKSSLKARFALMARCDTLGVPSAAEDAPLGLIVVSLSATSPGSALPGPRKLARALGLDAVSEPVTADGSLTFRAQGDAPFKGLSEAHWRGSARIGDQVLGLGFFAPAAGRAAGPLGRRMLNEVIAKSRAASM